VEEKPDDEGGGKRIRQGTSAERICSVHDPEMRHGRKSASVRYDGHKTQVVTDVETGLVAAVDVVEGSAKDEEGSLELVQEAGATTGLKVDEALADCAYGSGENRERFEEAGINLLAKVPKQPRSDFFTKDEFEIDLAAMSCRCPAGQTTTTLIKAGWHESPSGRRTQMHAFRFSAKVCGDCPLRSKCFKRSESNQHGRHVRLHPQEAKFQAARSWQRSAEFDDFRKQRQVVEHRIARLVQLGIRQARYFGRRKTLFQVLLAATVANLTLVAGRAAQLTPTIAPNALFSAVRTALQRLSRLARSSLRPATSFATTAPHLPRRPGRLAQMAVFRPHL
jgi:hypothetical protein